MYILHVMFLELILKINLPSVKLVNILLHIWTDVLYIWHTCVEESFMK